MIVISLYDEQSIVGISTMNRRKCTMKFLIDFIVLAAFLAACIIPLLLMG